MLIFHFTFSVRWGCCWAAVAAVGLLEAAVGSCGVTGATGIALGLLWCCCGPHWGCCWAYWGGCGAAGGPVGMEGHRRVSKMQVPRKRCVSAACS